MHGVKLAGLPYLRVRAALALLGDQGVVYLLRRL